MQQSRFETNRMRKFWRSFQSNIYRWNKEALRADTVDSFVALYCCVGRMCYTWRNSSAESKTRQRQRSNLIHEKLSCLGLGRDLGQRFEACWMWICFDSAFNFFGPTFADERIAFNIPRLAKKRAKLSDTFSMLPSSAREITRYSLFFLSLFFYTWTKLILIIQGDFAMFAFGCSSVAEFQIGPTWNSWLVLMTRKGYVGFLNLINSRFLQIGFLVSFSRQKL